MFDKALCIKCGAVYSSYSSIVTPCNRQIFIVLQEAVQELQKRVADEKHERAVMQARIMSCNKDMDKQKLDMRHEEVKRRKMSTDIERQVKAVLDKVTIQRQKHAEIKEVCVIITQYCSHTGS